MLTKLLGGCQMIFKDYYKILELKTNKVTLEEIRTAYRIAVKKNHPDVNVGNKLAEEKIKDINEAYRVLSDSAKKRKYDRMWNSNVAKKNQEYQESKRSTGSVFSDFFNMFFGQVKEEERAYHKKVPIKGENVETEINISIEEGFYDNEKIKKLQELKKELKKSGQKSIGINDTDARRDAK